MRQILAHSSNYKQGRTLRVQYIVIHYTGNDGDRAIDNLNYFANNPNKYTSAHYFVDENEVCLSVPTSDTAWHCGGERVNLLGGKFYGVCRNSNSIGIELCSRLKNGVYYLEDKTIQNAAQLVNKLMAEFKITPDRVIRHYDVTGKFCPRPFVEDESQWAEFQKLITKEDDAVMAMVYNYVDKNMPLWAHEAVKWAVHSGIVKGSSEGLGLTDQDLKTLTFMYRYSKIK